jgi:hypothetical protein
MLVNLKINKMMNINKERALQIYTRLLTGTGLSIITFILLSALVNVATAQEAKVITAMKEFHQALVKKDTLAISQLTHPGLSYGHSNGWIENKTEMLKNNITRYIDYHTFTEDSIHAVVSGNVSCIRFIANINSNFAGNPPTALHLKVLEVWVMDHQQWLLLARQAVR